jgi:hypothetical protein
MVKIELNFSNKFVYLSITAIGLLLVAGIVIALQPHEINGHESSEIKLDCKVKEVAGTIPDQNDIYAICDGSDEIAIAGGCISIDGGDPDSDGYAVWPGVGERFAKDGETPNSWGCDTSKRQDNRIVYAICCKTS